MCEPALISQRAGGGGRGTIADVPRCSRSALNPCHCITTVFPGKIIADAMDKVGKDGVITVEEAKSMETSLDVVEGMQFDRGYLSRFFFPWCSKSPCGASSN